MDVSAEDANHSLFLLNWVQDVDGSPMLNMDGLEADNQSAVIVKGGVSYLNLNILKKIQEKLAWIIMYPLV